MNREPQKLYRPYNKTAHGFHTGRMGGDYSDARHSKTMQRFEGKHLSIGQTHIGYDYTPLFRFLLSKVGREWDEVLSEAVAWLDKQEPIFWMVELHTPTSGVVRIGDNSYYSCLNVRDGVLVKVEEAALPPKKGCTCCTHTFNGVPY